MRVAFVVEDISHNDRGELDESVVATPTMWGLAKSAYVGTFLDTVFDLQANGIGVRYVLHDGADITLARNLLASLFYEDITCTHAFFIDSDMQFSSRLCRRLISLDKPVIVRPTRSAVSI